MPEAGTGKNKKHFPYTKKGYQAAAKHAAKTNTPLKNKRKKVKRKA
jgi:hypothetical protein